MKLETKSGALLTYCLLYKQNFSVPNLTYKCIIDLVSGTCTLLPYKKSTRTVPPFLKLI